MARRVVVVVIAVLQLFSSATVAGSQTVLPDESVIQKIWAEAIDHSQLYPLAQTLLDAIGPRVTGSPEQQRATEWATATYQAWGITSRAERYGTWNRWSRGSLHVDLIAPRVRSLEGMLMTLSPGTKRVLDGKAIVFPELRSRGRSLLPARSRGLSNHRVPSQPTRGRHSEKDRPRGTLEGSAGVNVEQMLA
jgi:carboxypeptidase Q